MTRETSAWYTLPCYSLEDVLLLAQATNDAEALRYYDEQKKIKEKENDDGLSNRQVTL